MATIMERERGRKEPTEIHSRTEGEKARKNEGEKEIEKGHGGEQAVFRLFVLSSGEAIRSEEEDRKDYADQHQTDLVRDEIPVLTNDSRSDGLQPGEIGIAHDTTLSNDAFSLAYANLNGFNSFSGLLARLVGLLGVEEDILEGKGDNDVAHESGQDAGYVADGHLVFDDGVQVFPGDQARKRNFFHRCPAIDEATKFDVIGVELFQSLTRYRRYAPVHYLLQHRFGVDQNLRNCLRAEKIQRLVLGQETRELLLDSEKQGIGKQIPRG